MRRREVVASIAALAAEVATLPISRASRGADLAAVVERWERDEHPDLKGVVVRADGRVVAERYFNGESADALHDMRSASKSITSLLIGAALDRGFIHSLADSVERYLPEARGSAIGDVSLADVLSALFDPLGIERFSWARDRTGHTKGQGNLSITASAMAKIGQMMLDGGRFAGERVLSPAWVTASLTPRVTISSVDPYADGYGYFWYTKTLSVGPDTMKIHFASGNGGNKIYIVPARRWVVAITSSAYNSSYGQRRSQDILLALLSA